MSATRKSEPLETGTLDSSTNSARSELHGHDTAPGAATVAQGRTEPLDLDALTALEAAATPGPWRATANRSVIDPDGELVVASVAARKDWPSRRDAALIAAARNALPGLLAERLRLRQDIASLGHWWCPSCEAIPPGVVDDDMCSRCGNQAEWSEPETLTSVKAYAERVKRARDEAWTERDEARAKRDQAVENAVAWMDEARRQAAERDREYQRAEGLATRLTTVTGQRNDALQMVADLGDMRASLSAAEDARDDAQRERDALRAELVGWAELTTVELTDAGRLHMAEADTGDDQYAVLLSDQPVDEAAASEAYRQRGEGDVDG